MYCDHYIDHVQLAKILSSVGATGTHNIEGGHYNLLTDQILDMTFSQVDWNPLLSFLSIS